MEIIGNLRTMKLKTVDLSGNKLIYLTKDKKEKFKNTIEFLLNDLSTEDGVTITFRGFNRKHILTSLVRKDEDVDENKLIELLFYFGEKAKHYYKVNDVEAGKSRWIKNIEDCSYSSAKAIFEKIRNILKKDDDKISEFKKSAPEFTSYFLSDNKQNFIKAISSHCRARDYYLFFLHTAGKIGISDKTVLISTSKSEKIPENFFDRNDDNYIIYYVIPKEIDKYAISHLSKLDDKKIKELSSDLPIYNGGSLYPDQEEIGVKGALFSHHILGVMRYPKSHKEFFIPNPHIFTKINQPDSILSGLYIDQSDFMERLDETGCHRGVGILEDATFSTIAI